MPGDGAPITNVVGPAGGRAETIQDYEIRATVTDDLGLLESPLLHYSVVEPEAGSIAGMDLVPFTALENNEYRADIPNLGLEVGEERTVYFVVSALDDDDKESTKCDHRAVTPVSSFVAVEPLETDKVGFCESCTADRQCENGLCIATVPGFCGENCEGEGADCGADRVCYETPSKGGISDWQCVPASQTCGDMCIDEIRGRQRHR